MNQQTFTYYENKTTTYNSLTDSNNSCQYPNHGKNVFKEVLTKLEKIESATYYVTDESRQPDDSTTLFSSKEFELIAIESWSRQVSSIRNYANRKKLNDTILNAANEVIKQYQTSGATPYFFIVDQEGIRSYSKENTDKEIIHTIKELL